jgi:hypothetical protein
MSSNLRDLQASAPDLQDDPSAGLSSDELQAEQAGDMPDREAMSILDVGNIGVGLPTPADIADQLGPIIPPGVGPVEGPIDPIEMAGQLPVDITGQLPDGTVPVAPPGDGDVIGIPESPGVVDDSETIA